LAPAADAAKSAAELGAQALLSCPVCSAPTFPLDGACVFCHSPLSGPDDDPNELLEYLAERVPGAHVKRGPLSRGPITEIAFELGGRTFRARWKKEDLDLQPPVELTAWLDLLLTRLSDTAAHDAALRRSVLRSGWALR
jgi:hypothetical protein